MGWARARIRPSEPPFTGEEKNNKNNLWLKFTKLGCVDTGIQPIVGKKFDVRSLVVSKGKMGLRSAPPLKRGGKVTPGSTGPGKGFEHAQTKKKSLRLGHQEHPRPGTFLERN